MSERVIGLIPAKTESARVPGKNWRPLGGEPLVNWTVEAALESEQLTEVWVIGQWSDPPVALPPPARWLQSPTVMGLPAEIEWALTELDAKPSDVVVQLLPTSPFRRGRHIDAALARWHELGPECSVISVTPEPDLARRLRYRPSPDSWLGSAFTLRDPGDLLVVSNGAVQVASVRWFWGKWIRGKSLGFHGGHTYGHDLPLPWGLDIDTEPDWRLAEAYASKMLEQEVAV